MVGKKRVDRCAAVQRVPGQLADILVLTVIRVLTRGEPIFMYRRCKTVVHCLTTDMTLPRSRDYFALRFVNMDRKEKYFK